MTQLDEYRKGIVYIPEHIAWKLTRGIVLPENYHLPQLRPSYDFQRQSWIVVVEGPDIPITPPGSELPSLEILHDYEAIVVKRYSGK